MLEAILELAREIFFFAGYVRGGNAFPPQLSPQEEKTLIERLGKGDGEARCKLIELICAWLPILRKSTVAPSGIRTT